MKSLYKKLFVLAVVILIVVVGIFAYGFMQYSEQRGEFESAIFEFSKWRMTRTTPIEFTVSIEYSVENPSDESVTIQDFDLLMTFENVTGATRIKKFSLDPGQTIERTVQITMPIRDNKFLLDFIADSDVHLSGIVYFGVLSTEIPADADYDAPSKKFVF